MRTPRERLATATASVAALCIAAASLEPATAVAQTTKPARAKAAAAAPATATSSSLSEQAIVVLVNDEPITAYEIEQRSRLIIMMSGAVGEYMQKNIQDRWKRAISSPSINEEFRNFAMKHNPRTQEDIQRLQKAFIEDKQKRLRDELMREARAKAAQGVRQKAQDELIEERLKLQEAKRLNLTADDADVDKVIQDIAQRNKMTLQQFSQHIASQGGDIDAMRSRFRATLSWNQVVRRRFGHQVSVAEREIDKAVAAGPAGEDRVELQLQRIVLPVSGIDQRAAVARLAEAERIKKAYGGCKSIAAAAKRVPDARVENLGARKPSSIPEPTRSMLAGAKEGDLLPPSVGSDGVEMYAVCGQTVVKASDAKRTAAQDELRQREFELLARRHLKDLRQDASIEFR